MSLCSLAVMMDLRSGSFFIDPPSGWQYGFPDIIPAAVMNDEDKLRAFIISKGYPVKTWDEWAKNHCRFWRASS